jgi:ATP-binding cassette subfamily B protein
VLKNADRAELDKLNPIMGKAILAVSAMVKIKSAARAG